MLEHKQEIDTLSSQKRTANWVTLITFILMGIVSVVTVFFVPNKDKTIVDNFLIPGVAICAGYSYYLSRKGDHIRGIYILLGFIAIASALYPFAADNVGWQTAIGMLLITTSISNATLPAKTARRISTLAFVFSLIIILIEIFVSGKTVVTPKISSIVILGVLILIYLGVIFFRFRQYTLQTKLIITFITLSILSVSITALIINGLISRQLTSKAKEDLNRVTKNSASSISKELTLHINLIQALALDASLQKALSTQQTNSNPTELASLDIEWQKAVEANNVNSLIRSVIQNPIASNLRSFQENFPTHVEVFVTNKYGATVAATNITSDYNQSDEIWWQSAYNTGQGAVYISQPVFDESIQTLSLEIAIPVYAQDKSVLGVLRSTLNLNVLVPVLQSSDVTSSGLIEIYLPDGRELELQKKGNGKVEIKIELSTEDVLTTLSGDSIFTNKIFSGDEFLASGGKPVLISQFFVSPLENTASSNAIKKLNWSVVTIQDREEALQTVSDTSRTSQLIGLGAIAFASLLAVVMTQYLTKPIVRLTQVAEQISAGKLQTRAEFEAPDEIGQLADAFNKMTSQLRETLLNLEQRVAERTTDLEMARYQSEKRTDQLLAISELSKLINNEQNINNLLSLITRLVSERFGFYHTGIFLVDETKQYAVLQAANSIGGQAMLRRGHKLEVGETSIVGYVAKHGQPRIALNIETDATYFNNPDLPDTRSEIAIPLKLRNTVIGVLDVQSEKPGAFTNDDTNTLSILGDQIAIAIQNARLFSETQVTLNEMQMLYRQNLHEGWRRFSQEEGAVGYLHSLGSSKALTEPIASSEIQQVLNRGETTVSEQNSQTNFIIVPIKLRGQVIGVMRIQSHQKDKTWNSSEINLTEAVSERLSLALENARLIQESQRQVIKEQAISDITSKIGGSINLENVLQTAVEELGRSIPGSEVIIKLKEDLSNGDLK